MDRLEAMGMLVTVTEQGSLSAAARTLRVPLATLSRKVSDLEKAVGARLLIRTTRRLTLTDAGVAYVAAARRILATLFLRLLALSNSTALGSGSPNITYTNALFFRSH